MNFQIGKFFNIPLYLNLLTVPFAAIILMDGSLSLAVFILSIFFIILHEYGHCFMAKKYGWKVFDITILPIGGIAKIIFKHNNPKQEIYVSLAGPAVNLLLTLPFFMATVAAFIFHEFSLMFLFLVCTVSNLFIVIFNILPVFPMDGGRVLRASLAIRIGHKRATWWAVRVGQVGGIFLSVVCLYFQFWLAGFIFILMGIIAQVELKHAQLVETVHDIKIKLANILNKPELIDGDLLELINTVESIQDEELKQKIQAEELLRFIKALAKANVGI